MLDSCTQTQQRNEQSSPTPTSHHVLFTVVTRVPCFLPELLCSVPCVCASCFHSLSYVGIHHERIGLCGLCKNTSHSFFPAVGCISRVELTCSCSCRVLWFSVEQERQLSCLNPCVATCCLLMDSLVIPVEITTTFQ